MTASSVPWRGGTDMKPFYIHIPGWVYAATVYGRTRQEAAERFKLHYNLARMPIGYSIWSA